MDSDAVDSDTDSEMSNRVLEVMSSQESVRAFPKGIDCVDVMTSALDHGVESRSQRIRYILDTGVNRILLSEDDWLTLESRSGGRQPKLKKTKRKFVPFGRKEELACLGRSKVKLRAVAGATIRSMVYVILMSRNH